MIKALLKVLLVFPLLAAEGAQYTVPSVTGANANATSCVAPTTTDRWVAWDSSTSCGGSCSNGSQISNISDLVGTHGFNQATSARQPIYVTNVINGLAAAHFVKANTNFMQMTTAITLSGGFTLYAVVKPNLTANTGGAVIAGTSNNNLEWALSENSAGTFTEQYANSQGVVLLGSGGFVLSTSAPYTIVVQYNTSTHAWNFWSCSGGTCSSQASGTTSSSLTQFQTIGGAINVTEYVDAYIAEVGYMNSTTTTGIGAWSLCKYGI